MIVIDASAMVEALIGRDVDEELLGALAGDVAAPHLLDVEVLSILRGLVRGSKLDEQAAVTAHAHHFGLTIHRCETDPVSQRVWDLRHRYTAYDASYIAVAEALGAPLHTCDAKLASGGHHATVRVHGRTH